MTRERGGSWSGDLLIADWEEIEKAETPEEIYFKRFKAGEIYSHEGKPITSDITYRFPLDTGTLSQPTTDAKTLRERKQKLLEKQQRQQQLEKEQQDKAKREEQLTEQQKQKDVLEDYWTINDCCLIRHHVTPRKHFFVPNPNNCPLPLKYLDITRRTETNLDLKAEQNIYDFWTTGDKWPLSDWWEGKNRF